MDSPRPARILSPWDLATLAGVLALACFYLVLLPSLPDPVPTHFDAVGRANGWTSKALLPWVVFGAPLFLWVVLFLLGAVATLLPGGTGRTRALAIDPLRGLMGLGLCLLMAGCLLVPSRGVTALFSGLLALFFCMVLGIVFLVRDAWQAIARLPRADHYRGGIFYSNPQDPRLWVEKRLGLGWTLNYARPAAIWVTALILAAILGVLLAVFAVVRH